MMTRQLLTIGTLLLLPTLAWAINEVPIEKPTEQSIPSEQPAVKPASVTSTPASPISVSAEKLAPLLSAPAIPVSALNPASIAPAKPAPNAPQVSPAKPIPFKTIPTKSIPAQNPVIAKSAPAISAPVKAVHTPDKPIVPATSIAKPAATTLKTTSPSGSELISASIDESIDIEFFIREGCIQCDTAKDFLTKLQKLKPELKISIRDVRKEPAALELLKRMAQNHGDAALDYPAFVVGGQLIIGFTDEANSAQQILDTIAVAHPPHDRTNEDTESCITGKDLSCGLIKVPLVAQEKAISFDIFGHNVSLLQIGLPLFTIAMGLLDGLNHGSIWVLVLMISLLSPMNNRPLMIAIAGTFIFVQSIFYFILMVAWLNLNMLIETSRFTGILFGSIALFAGVTYLVKYIYFGEKLTLSSHEISKPGIYTRIRKIVETEGLFAILLSTAALAILVQLGEFAFTSVFPVLYTKVLSLQHLSSLSNYSYLLLYDFAYMLDDTIVLAIGVITLSQTRPELTEGRTLKLISGLLMMALAGYLLFA
jgi:glutaredoxin